LSKIAIISDIHGKWNKYLQILKDLDAENISSIQLGDFGIYDENDIFEIPIQHKFFVGNHDNRTLAKTHPNCLGDYGMLKNGIFFISGAFSIDKDERTIGFDWWDDEELSYQELEKVISLYEESKPNVVVSHDCPADIYNFFGYVGKSRTAQALQSMFQIHQPDKWIFGHHHIDFMSHYDGTEFHCLGVHKKMILEY